MGGPSNGLAIMIGYRTSRRSSSFLRRWTRLDIAAVVAAGLAVLAGMSLSQARATTLLSPQVDFRASLFAAANNKHSFSATVDGIGFTLTAETTGSGTAKLWWDATDGIGIRHDYEDDEIEGSEYLRLTFDRTIGLSEIYISDLFIESGYAEIGMYQVVGSDAVVFDAASLAGTDGNKANGEHLITIDPAIAVSEIRFFAPGYMSGRNHEYSVIGFTDPPLGVAEPGTLAILVLGLAGLGTIRRRHTA